MISVRFRRFFALAVLAGVAPSLAGCPDECEGARCAGLYPAANLNLLENGLFSEPTVSPLDDATAQVIGEEAGGHDWALVGVGRSVLAGVPALGQVRRYDHYSFYDGTTAPATVVDAEPDSRFGAAIATLSDGFLVGAPGHTVDSYATSTGAVYIFDGGAADLSGATTTDAAVRWIEGENAEDRLGEVVAGCGDLDADGVVDWAAAAPWTDWWGAEGDDDDARLAGTVYVGLSGASLPTGRVGLDRLVAIEETIAGASFGASIDCGSVLDGDGVAELLVGAPYAFGENGHEGAGVVRIWRGGVGFSGGTPLLVLSGPEPEAWFGAALATGDMDGDGAPELVVGATGVDGDGQDTTGAAYVFIGAELDPRLNLPEFSLDELEAVASVSGAGSSGRFGSTVLLADVDGDDLADLIVGAPGLNPTGRDENVQAGAAYVFLGDPTLWEVTRSALDADAIVSEDRQYLRTGDGLAIADLSLDGLPDLVVLNRMKSTGLF